MLKTMMHKQNILTVKCVTVKKICTLPFCQRKSNETKCTLTESLLSTDINNTTIRYCIFYKIDFDINKYFIKKLDDCM